MTATRTALSASLLKAWDEGIRTQEGIMRFDECQDQGRNVNIFVDLRLQRVPDNAAHPYDYRGITSLIEILRSQINWEQLSFPAVASTLGCYFSSGAYWFVSCAVKIS